MGVLLISSGWPHGWDTVVGLLSLVSGLLRKRDLCSCQSDLFLSEEFQPVTFLKHSVHNIPDLLLLYWIFCIYTNCNKFVIFYTYLPHCQLSLFWGKITDSHTTYKGKLRGPFCPPSVGGVVRQLHGCAACQAPHTISTWLASHS